MQALQRGKISEGQPRRLFKLMDQLIFFTRGAGFACILLLLLRTILAYRSILSGKLLLFVCLGLAAYLLLPLLELIVWARTPATLLAISVPVSFWLLCDSLFNDWDSRGWHLDLLHWLIVAIFLLLSFFVYWLMESGASGGRLYLPLFYTAYAMRTVFLLLALWSVIRHWQDDLMESRRVLRRLMLATSGIYMLLVIVVELILRGTLAPPALEAANSIGLSLLLLIITAWFITVNPSELFNQSEGIPAIPGSPSSHESEDRKSLESGQNRSVLTHTERKWLSALESYIMEKKGYRQPELTVSNLAKELAIPEHILRRLINQLLGFRNFRDYINQYRLDEVSTRLKDPANERIPILTIALDAGFASINPFNRAFKSRFQCTPREFRKQSLSK